MDNLVHIIRQQLELSKAASSALVDIGEAIQAIVAPQKLGVLLYGTLMQEVYVRNPSSRPQTPQVNHPRQDSRAHAI